MLQKSYILNKFGNTYSACMNKYNIRSHNPTPYINLTTLITIINQQIISKCDRH